MRLTKIVCTIGPACDTQDAIEELIASGMDVARLNFSHGTHASHLRLLRMLRRASKKLGKPIAILEDLCGPRVRVGRVEGGEFSVAPGEEIELVGGEFVGNRQRLAVGYERFARDVHVGASVLIDDGIIELKVTGKKKDVVRSRVVRGGVIREGKGMNLPGVRISEAAVTRKDLADLEWGIKQHVDFVGLSFVRSADDVRLVKRKLHKRKSPIQVIAKIEKPEAVDKLKEIVEAADGIMIARGDLGVEMRVEHVPLIQKRIIELCQRLNKPVITATQMLESMTTRQTPTRAEVSDVANAILDGSDALMLSGETAIGKFPAQSVREMDRIARATEGFADFKARHVPSTRPDPAFRIASAISEGAFQIVRLLGASLVVVSTESGHTALLVSKERMETPILGVSTSDEAVRRMCLYFGVYPVKVPRAKTLAEIMTAARNIALKSRLAKVGDVVLLVSGYPLGRTGTTNTLQVHRLLASHKRAE